MAEPVGSEQVFTQGHFRGSSFIDVTRTYPEQASALAASKKLTAENRSYLQWVKQHYDIDIEKKQVRRKTGTLAAAVAIPIGAVVKTEELTEAMKNCLHERCHFKGTNGTTKLLRVLSAEWCGRKARRATAIQEPAHTTTPPRMGQRRLC